MTNPFRRIPLGAVVGGTLMSALVAWGFVERHRRAEATLGGRYATLAPAWAADAYADLCAKAGRCDTPWDAIRWYAHDSTVLPLTVCQTAYEAQGCYEGETRALTLTAAGYADTVLVRHELMHAAIWTRWAGRHPCRFFRDDWRTLTPNGCEP